MTDAEARLNQALADYAASFDTEAGRRVLHDLMERFNVTRAHLTSDTNDQFFREGQRSVVLHIFTMLRLTPRDIASMMMRQPTMLDDL